MNVGKRGMIFQDWLKNDSKIVLFDGGMGTELIKRGLEPGKVPDMLNIEKSDTIVEIHKSYYDAGSDMCQSNTFGSTPLNLRRHNLEDRISEIIEKALENIKKAGANVIVNPCPFCHLQYDRGQKDLGEKETVPVLHLSQLYGLALGVDEKKLGFGEHATPVKLPS